MLQFVFEKSAHVKDNAVVLVCNNFMKYIMTQKDK